jgi:hypothetical protein
LGVALVLLGFSLTYTASLDHAYARDLFAELQQPAGRDVLVGVSGATPEDIGRAVKSEGVTASVSVVDVRDISSRLPAVLTAMVGSCSDLASLVHAPVSGCDSNRVYRLESSMGGPDFPAGVPVRIAGCGGGGQIISPVQVLHVPPLKTPLYNLPNLLLPAGQCPTEASTTRAFLVHVANSSDIQPAIAAMASKYPAATWSTIAGEIPQVTVGFSEINIAMFGGAIACLPMLMALAALGWAELARRRAASGHALRIVGAETRHLSSANAIFILIPYMTVGVVALTLEALLNVTLLRVLDAPVSVNLVSLGVMIAILVAGVPILVAASRAGLKSTSALPPRYAS